MTTPPVIWPTEPAEPVPLGDVLARTAASFAIAIAGFWYPLWWSWRLHDPDDRLGFVTGLALPFIAFYAGLASLRIYQALKHGLPPSRAILVPLSVLVVFSSWLPLLFVTFNLATSFL